MPEILRAINWAKRAHAGQIRKYTGGPYFRHCEEVAGLVMSAGGDKTMVAAAYLHDTLEDTNTTHDQIHDLFGTEIAELVYWLTDQSMYRPGNRATRKKIDRDHIAAAPANAQTIKLADLISNTRSIVKHDPNFAKVYLAEKLLLLDVLTKGDPNLHTYATQLAHRGLTYIEKALNRCPPTPSPT